MVKLNEVLRIVSLGGPKHVNLPPKKMTHDGDVLNINSISLAVYESSNNVWPKLTCVHSDLYLQFLADWTWPSVASWPALHLLPYTPGTHSSDCCHLSADYSTQNKLFLQLK